MNNNAVMKSIVVQLLVAMFTSMLAFSATAVEMNTITIDSGTTIVIQSDSTIDVSGLELSGSSDPIIVSNEPIVVSSAPKKSGPICGGIVNGKPQAACGKKQATFESAAVGKCPKGSFFDIGKWQCWSCPKNTKRTLHAVDSDRACSRKASKTETKTRRQAATFLAPLCAKGSFYDPIRGGECWSCPKGYKRSLAHVGAKNACYIPAKRVHKKVNKHKKATGLLGLKCPKGQFWDGIDGYCYSCPSGYKRSTTSVRSAKACFKRHKEKQKKASVVKKAKCRSGEIRDLKVKGKQKSSYGGGCWTCPSTYRRTVFPIDGNKACGAPPKVVFSKATKVQDLTCPQGQIFDFIGLTKKDIAARKLKAKPVKSGTCWSCPNGYKRTASSVKSKNACKAKTMGWYSQPFSNPGLFGLAGAKEVLLEVVKKDPTFIKESVRTVAESVAKDSKQSFATVYKKEKEIFTNNPHQSTAAAGVILARMIAAVGNDKKSRTKAEQQLIDSFKKYVKERRTWIAEDALAAYDAWKEADDYSRGNRPSNMGSLLDYGTVPPDFQTLAMVNSLAIGSLDTTLGIATGSLPLVGDVLSLALTAGTNFAAFSNIDSAGRLVAKTAAEVAIAKAIEFAVVKFAKASAAAITKELTTMVGATLTKQVVGRTLSAAGSAGPQIIIAASLMIGQMALEQVIEIANARPKLKTALAGAKQSPDLPRLAQTEDGMGEIMGHWSFAISGNKKADSKYLNEFKTATKFVQESVVQAKAQKTKAQKTKKVASAGRLKQGVAPDTRISWKKLPGKGSDVGAGGGKLFVIGGKEVIYKWDGGKKKWQKFTNGRLTRIDADSNGNPWGVNSKGKIYRYKKKWIEVKDATAKDIGVAGKGTSKAWIIGTKKLKGGYDIKRRTKTGKWKTIPGAAVRIDVDSKGNAWIVNANGSIYRYTGKKWQGIKGPKAADITVSRDDKVFIAGKDQKPYLYKNNKWHVLPGLITTLSGTRNNEILAINKKGGIYLSNGAGK